MEMNLHINDYLVIYAPSMKRPFLIKVVKINDKDVSFDWLLPENYHASFNGRLSIYPINHKITMKGVPTDYLYSGDDYEKAMQVYNQKLKEDQFDL